MIKKIAFLLLALLIFGCGGNNGTSPATPGLSVVYCPLNNNFDSNLLIIIRVADPQGPADIDSVWGSFWFMENQSNSSPILLNDNGVDGDSTAGDEAYSAVISPLTGFFQFGYYRLRVQAVDKSGNSSAGVDRIVWMVDGDGPILFDVAAPDSIQRGSQTPAYITVRAYDPDGRSDIDSVFFISLRPDSTSSGSHFYMFDDGQTYEDQAANDGQYTIGIVTDVSNQLGDYTFTFFALDSSGNQSNNPFVIVTVY